MALIRLRLCAGWSEPLLVTHTTLLEISCRSSFEFYNELNRGGGGGGGGLPIYDIVRMCGPNSPLFQGLPGIR